MAASADFAEFLRELLAPLGPLTMRRMFGKTGVFCDGVMLGMVADNTLYFRVDDGNRAAFREAETYPPLNYEKQGRGHRTSVLACARANMFDEPDELGRMGAAGGARGGASCCCEDETPRLR